MKLSREELLRYARQLPLAGFGVEAQLKLKRSSVLVVGAGGLGCPALLYLTAAGIGKIGVMDFDTVELHNLHRQVLYTENDVGIPKSTAAADHLRTRNSFVEFESIHDKLTQKSALHILPRYDLVLDCTDNFPARYAINDACVANDKPFVYGSVFKFEGQVSLFNAKDGDGNHGPTYRCLFPDPPAEGSVPSCEDAGVVGFLPGLIGTIQAAEAVKWLTGTGQTLSGKLLTVNSFNMAFNEFEIKRNEALWSPLFTNEITA